MPLIVDASVTVAWFVRNQASSYTLLISTSRSDFVIRWPVATAL